VTGSVAIVGCLYLLLSLPVRTQLYFLAWNGIGLVVYMLIAGRRKDVA
jgi:basic amino acid/polyamine antiporter, APA family